MSQLPLLPAAPLRQLALTVEEPTPGMFRWRILEASTGGLDFESLTCTELLFADYDAALATGYGELQRLIGPELQFGPRHEFIRPAAAQTADSSLRA